MIHVTINGKPVEVSEGSITMEAIETAGIRVPSLCYMENIHQYSSCRTCVMEMEGMKSLQVSYMAKVREGVVIRAHSPRVLATGKVSYELLLSNHPKNCLNCNGNTNCELQELGYELGASENQFGGATTRPVVNISLSITRDTGEYALYRRCVTVYTQIQKAGAAQAQNRGSDMVVSPAMGLSLNSTTYAMCGQCTAVCPTGALRKTDDLTPVWWALADPEKGMVVQVAPAVRTALGEEFGLPIGTPVTGKMATAPYETGLDDMFDILSSADLATLKEGTELLDHLNAALKGNESQKEETVLLTVISCSPGWIKHIEHQFPEELDYLSACKSPRTMLDAMVKSFYTECTVTAPENMFVVSVMPCTTKKCEMQRLGMEVDGNRSMDAVLTTRELIRMVKTAGIDFVNLPEGEFGAPLGLGTGAADIFGVIGDVMRTVLRTVYKVVTGRELPSDRLHVAPVVGLEQAKTASITTEDTLPTYEHLEGVTVNVAIVSGLENASMSMDEVAAGISPCHFIEVTGCPGGYINGGGQPRCMEENYREECLSALYSEDEHKVLCKSRENPDLMKLYSEYLSKPDGHLSHHLLHTHCVKRGKYNQLA